jgi:hypothetical protein
MVIPGRSLRVDERPSAGHASLGACAGGGGVRAAGRAAGCAAAALVLDDDDLDAEADDVPAGGATRNTCETSIWLGLDNRFQRTRSATDRS